MMKTAFCSGGKTCELCGKNSVNEKKFLQYNSR